MEVVLKPLTAEETAMRSIYEANIKKGLNSFLDVGSSLMAMRDKKLYRSTHGTFEDYCQQAWNLNRTYAFDIIKSAKAVENVRHGEHPVPVNERQARPLTKLDDPKEQVAAWKEVVATAPKDDDGHPKITAKHVESVVQERLAESSDAKPSPPEKNTQWERLNDLCLRARSYFEQMIAERRENDKSNAVLNLFEELDSAVAAYRKSVKKNGV